MRISLWRKEATDKGLADSVDGDERVRVARIWIGLKEGTVRTGC